MEGERERVEVNSERICLDCFLCPNSCRECLEVNANFEVRVFGVLVMFRWVCLLRFLL